MADVSVEFGAKDTGLEQTLKTVQAQLTSLEEEVKSGTLSFDELQQTMRKISQAEKVQDQLQAMATSMGEAGNAASAAEPKLDALGNEATDMGNKVQGAGQKTSDSAGLFDAGFAKIAAAFTVGNLAAKGFEAIVNGVFSAARAVVDGFGDALDLGGRLDDLSKRTGETAGSLFILEGAFKEAGLSADQVGTTINKLQNFMQDASNGGERQTATMNKLGISLEQLAGKTPTQQMEIFAQKIAGIQDPTQRASTASEVFGEKLGGKLLPLLLEFPQTLDNVRDRTGGMADVMDESAATFARAGDTIDAVSEKLTAFAAGILSETLPALESLGKSMEEVDAAGLGKQVGEALAPALQKLTDATSGAIEVLKMLGDAEKKAQQDTGLLGQSYDAVYASLSGFNRMMHDTFTTFTPFGMGMEYLRQKGEELRTANDQAAEGVQAVGDAATEVAPVLETTSGSAERFATSLQDIGTDSGQAFTDINNGATTFKSLVDEGNISLSDMSGEIGGQIPLQTEQIALVGELNTSLGEANEKAGEQLAKIEQQVAAEQARNEKIAERQEKSAADYQLQIQINEALAAGNTELAEGLQYQREHSQLTEKIMRETGMSKEEASQLATNFLASKDAADAASESARKLGGDTAGAAGEAGKANENFKSVRDTMTDIENAKMEASPQRLKERTADAREELKGMADFIGQDLSKMPLDDILTKLGLDPSDFATTDQKLTALEGSLEKLGSADPAEITPEVDLVGVNDRLEKVKEYLSGTEKEKPDVTPQIDQGKLKTAVDSAKAAIEKGLSKNKTELNLNAEKAIGKIRKDLKEQIDVAIQSSKGTEHLSSIDKLVSKIESLVSKIEGKLPMQALSY
jgi:hypothetical protein